jgi:sucrose-6-phosphate hydrolase SacC (GH32 family)
VYLFSFFKDGQEKLFIAISDNGYEWKELNQGEPVFVSSIGTRMIRDPFIIEDEEGIFHLVWTDGWASRSIGYAKSNDLKGWKEEKLIPVMEHIAETKNTWAPEIFRDTAGQCYRIIWSSTVGKEKKRDHRIWSVTTQDFTTFSEAKVFFDPGYNVIDANVTDLGDTYIMLFKDERGDNQKGTSYKAIRSCYLSKEDYHQPSYSDMSELLTPALTEGPTLYSVTQDGKREWVMLVDRFQEDKYDAYRSSDLEKWENVIEIMSLPEGARHGSVIQLKKHVSI